MFRKSALYQTVAIGFAAALCLALLIGFLDIQAAAPSCTTMMISSGERVLFGNNEDSSMPDGLISFSPAVRGRFGMVKVGYMRTQGEKSWESYQGGMNDQGLAWDVLGIQKTPLNPHYERELAFWEDEFLGRILPYHSSVAQVVETAEQYDFGDSMSMLIFVADASGDAVAIGPGPDGEVGLYRKPAGDGYLVSVNRNPLIQDEGLGWWDNSAARDQMAQAMLAEMQANGGPSYASISEVLEAVHLDGVLNGFIGRLTTYSNIFDLGERVVYLYYQGQYNEFVRLDLAQELAKGEQVIPLDELFSPETIQAAERGFSRYNSLHSNFQAVAGILTLALLCGLVYGVYRWIRFRGMGASQKI
jgi:hypothetical protein